MTLRSLRCPDCGSEVDRLVPISEPKPSTGCACGQTMYRVFPSAPATPVPWQPHFNHATGTYVNNRQEFSDALKKGSEEQSKRTGMDHNYVPVDIADRQACGVPDEA